MIRVLRIMEYTYADSKTAEEDMSKWAIGASATKSFGPNKLVRSTVIMDLNYYLSGTSEPDATHIHL